MMNSDYAALTMTSPPSPALQACQPSIYAAIPTLPIVGSSGVFTIKISPMPIPAVFLALFPDNNLPSSSLVTWTLKLDLLTCDTLRKTGSPFRYFMVIHNRLSAGLMARNFAGLGAVGVPRVTFVTKPCRSNIDAMATDWLV